MVSASVRDNILNSEGLFMVWSTKSKFLFTELVGIFKENNGQLFTGFGHKSFTNHLISLQLSAL